jgi:addiction module RelE/StbE family toxin
MEEKIVWSLAATEDLENIYSFIARDSKYYAGRFVDELLEKIELLPSQPLVGRVVPEKEDHTIREIIKGNYRIMYSIHKLPQIIIYRIIHNAQNFK